MRIGSQQQLRFAVEHSAPLVYSILKISKKTREENPNLPGCGGGLFEVFTRVGLLQERRKIEGNFL